MTRPSVSVILPAYNEAPTIATIIGAILASAPKESEVLLIDDNSPDGTATRAKEAFVNEPRVRVIVRTSDRGLARSVRAGIEAARSDLVIVMDSDFNHDPADIPRFVGVSQFSDIVSGSRFAPGGNMPDKGRYLASFLYNLAIRVLLRTQVQDNLCGFYAMQRQKLLTLPLDRIFYGFGDYYFRLIHFAQRQGYSIIEIPVVYGTRLGGTPKNRLFPTFLQYTLALASFRLGH